ncbi:MAG: response regulator, partial [Reichenbachiella sp.]
EFMSDQIEELSGYPPSDFINNSTRSFSSIIAKADAERVSRTVTSAIDHKEPFTVQYNIICKSGAIKSVYERGQGMYSSNGELNYLTGVIIDTSNIEETKTNLQSANNFIEHIIDSMDSICIAVNNSLHITHWNSATTKLTGISKKNAIHSHLYDVYPSLKADDIIIQEALATNTPQMYLDHEHQTSTLNKEYVNLSISPINSGSQHGLVIQLNVVTDKHYPLQRHHHKIKLDALGNLATTIAHDFNNALAGIIGGAQLLLSPKVTIGEKAESYAQLILRTANNAIEFTDSIHALGNKELLLKKPLDLIAIITETLQLIQHQSEDSVLIQFENYASSTTINGNTQSLTLTLLKLITSIQNIIPEDTVLSMRARSVHLSDHQCAISHYSIKSGEFISIDIIDSSNSFSLEQFKFNIDPFTTEEFQSLNKLLIYKALLDHSGALEITNTNNGSTTTSLLFPISNTSIPDTHSSENQVPLSTSNSLTTGTILLVDDEESLILAGIDLLEDLGYTVLSARDGVDAIDIYSKNMSSINIVITDLFMPRKNGKEVLTEIISLNQHCKVIIVSGATRPKEVIELKKLGAYDVLQKPYNPQMLISLLEKALT